MGLTLTTEHLLITVYSMLPVFQLLQLLNLENTQRPEIGCF